MTIPKYAKIESERRFLVAPDQLPPLDDTRARLIEDLYLTGSRMRLRSITSSDSAPEYKLCKKYGSETTGAEPIVNIYLSPGEYALFAGLPGRRIRKSRFRLMEMGVFFGIDRFEDELQGLILAEIEVDSLAAAETIPVPAWTVREVTADPFFTGGNLCHIRASDLAAHIGATPIDDQILVKPPNHLTQ